MIIGCHVRMVAPDYILGSVREALTYKANALMLYTGAPQNTRRVEVEKMKTAEARELMAASGIPMEHMIVHAPYLINLANSVKPEVAELAVEFLNSEIKRTAAIGAKYIVVHPGSYTTADPETGIRTIIQQLNRLEPIPEGIVLCLETMAGKGSEVGRNFTEIARILEGLEAPEHYGFCLDTCHIHDGGYDVSDCDRVLDEADHYIGLSRLHVVHLNDSKNERGSHKDRHANIGDGKIGFTALYAFAVNPRIENIPKILETPYINDKPPYAEEIAMLREGIYRQHE